MGLMDRILLFLSVAPIALIFVVYFVTSFAHSLDEASGMPGVTSICLSCGEIARVCQNKQEIPSDEPIGYPPFRFLPPGS